MPASSQSLYQPDRPAGLFALLLVYRGFFFKSPVTRSNLFNGTLSSSVAPAVRCRTRVRTATSATGLSGLSASGLVFSRSWVASYAARLARYGPASFWIDFHFFRFDEILRSLSANLELTTQMLPTRRSIDRTPTNPSTKLRSRSRHAAKRTTDTAHLSPPVSLLSESSSTEASTAFLGHLTVKVTSKRTQSE